MRAGRASFNLKIVAGTCRLRVIESMVTERPLSVVLRRHERDRSRPSAAGATEYWDMFPVVKAGPQYNEVLYIQMDSAGRRSTRATRD